MKFTDEQLSRILGEHEAGNMRPLGAMRWVSPDGSAPRCCVVQAALNEYGPDTAMGLRPKASLWFDCYYRPRWTADGFLRRLEEQGLA